MLSPSNAYLMTPASDEARVVAVYMYLTFVQFILQLKLSL